MAETESIYFAPMEGITLAPFRRLYEKWYPGIDKYFTPFLTANQTFSFKGKEIRDILPENNREMPVVPQLLTNQADQFVWGIRELVSYGYREINLNLGCSMPMVAKRGRGAGFLKDPEKLDRFFDGTFSLLEKEMPDEKPAISVKMRIGVSDRREAVRLLAVCNRYPFSEMIVHPRLMTDLYENHPDLETFRMFYEECVHPLCYNGDINTREDVDILRNSFPDLKRIMIGRGLIRDPALILKLKEEDDEDRRTEEKYKEQFLDDLFRTYLDFYPDERQAVGKMKELWWYMKVRYPEKERVLRRIQKAAGPAEYRAAVREMWLNG